MVPNVPRHTAGWESALAEVFAQEIEIGRKTAFHPTAAGWRSGRRAKAFDPLLGAAATSALTSLAIPGVGRPEYATIGLLAWYLLRADVRREATDRAQTLVGRLRAGIQKAITQGLADSREVAGGVSGQPVKVPSRPPRVPPVGPLYVEVVPGTVGPPPGEIPGAPPAAGGIPPNAPEIVRDRIRERYPAERIDDIGEGESSGAMHAGYLIAGLDAGVKEWTWFVQKGACPKCLKLNGVTVPLGDHFPGTDVRHPPLHFRCRCACVFEPVGVPEGKSWPKTDSEIPFPAASSR